MKPNFEEILENNGFNFELFKIENEYSANNILLAMKEVWNLAIQTASEEAETELTNTCIRINKNSILKLKV